MRKSSIKRLKNGRNVIVARQSATADNRQGGNSIAINAVEMAVIRVNNRIRNR
ncbi:hypothetical protein [Salinithrix halophila]|uniref:Uncharacterized protein n=1 Tax=Salinithrix halophila TaxID=1485204 RepID=A0ABV8JHF7_9BACL